MHKTYTIQVPARLILALALAVPGVALAYDEKDAIHDCETHIRSKYKVSDLRDATAERLNDTSLHFKVQGLAKVDGNKHPWTCEVKNRRVTAAEYSGPKSKGMGTAEKFAIGAAAVAAGAVAINEFGKQGGASQSASGSGGAQELQDLVGARGSSGESALESRGYSYTSGSKSGGSSYTNYRKGSHCVTVRTVNGKYASIVDAPMADCEGGGQSGASQSTSGGGAGATELQDLVGARAAGGESELESRGYNYVAGNKKGGSSYTKYSNGWHCVTVRTTNGHYASIVDTPQAKCH